MRVGAALIVTSSLGACSRPSEALNVVLITLDTLRADALGTYGNPLGLSPHIDTLAASATVFDNAVSAIGTTFPSHTTMLTGLYPRDHGVRWNGDGLGDGFTTLAETLAERGYQTAAFVSVSSLLTRGGLHQGFSVQIDPPEKSPHALPSEEVNQRALSWLDVRSEEPFF